MSDQHRTGESRRPLPPIDLDKHADIATATFALG